MNSPYSPNPQQPGGYGQPAQPGQPNPYGQPGPYDQPTAAQQNPYDQPTAAQQNPYGQPGQQAPYGQPYGQPGPYGQPAPYGQPGTYPGMGVPASDYLRGAPSSFGQAISLAFKNAFDYNGRASLSSYWWTALFSGLCFLGLYALLLVVGLGLKSSAAAGIFGILFFLAAIAMFIVMLPLMVRRLHDSDRSGFWVFIDFVPFIGGIWLLVLLCMPGTPGPNRFG